MLLTKLQLRFEGALYFLEELSYENMGTVANGASRRLRSLLEAEMVD